MTLSELFRANSKWHSETVLTLKFSNRTIKTRINQIFTSDLFLNEPFNNFYDNTVCFMKPVYTLREYFSIHPEKMVNKANYSLDGFDLYDYSFDIEYILRVEGDMIFLSIDDTGHEYPTINLIMPLTDEPETITITMTEEVAREIHNLFDDRWFNLMVPYDTNSDACFETYMTIESALNSLRDV